MEWVPVGSAESERVIPSLVAAGVFEGLEKSALRRALMPMAWRTPSFSDDVTDELPLNAVGSNSGSLKGSPATLRFGPGVGWRS